MEGYGTLSRIYGSVQFEGLNDSLSDESLNLNLNPLNSHSSTEPWIINSEPAPGKEGNQKPTGDEVLQDFLIVWKLISESF